MIRNAEVVLKRFEKLKQDRSNWESHWQEIGDYMIPRKNDVNSFKTSGTKRNALILDNTGMIGCELLSGALHGMMTSVSSEWFGLTTGDDELDKDDDARFWMQDTVKKMHNLFNNSNFQTEIHEFYLDLCGFNTAGMSIMEDPISDVYFQTHFLKELYISENNKGYVDEIYRCFQWEPKKIIQEFGMANVPQYIREAFEQNKEEKFEIIHCTYPADELGGVRKRGFRHPFVSQYILTKDKIQLAVRGFEEQPWIVARWAKASGESYGRGPGMNALPEVKMLNLMEEVMIRSAQKVMDPPVQAPDDGFIMPIKLKPGSVNYYRSGSNNKDRVEPIFNDAKIEVGFEIMQARRARVKEAFYVDQLQLGQGKEMTATEVVQRTEEKMKILGPLLGRLQVEMLRPLIDRVFAIMMRKKRFLPLPPSLQREEGVKLGVRFSSIIAKMQRMGEAKSAFDTLNALGGLVQLDPTILDNINKDRYARGIANIFNFPQDFMNTKKEVDKIREGRAQAQQDAMAQQQEAHDAETLNKVTPAIAATKDMEEGEMIEEGQ